jgi:hypothetical protein
MMKNYHLLQNLRANIDKSRGLTLPSQNQRNYNQHANSARPSFSSHTFQPCQGAARIFTSRQQQAFSSTMRPYTSNNNRPQKRPNTRPNNPSPAQPRPNHDSQTYNTPSSPFSTTESRHKTTLQTNFIQQYKLKTSSKQ